MKLSVCMMVRDEEENLARCLSSFVPAEGFCDELIVVDTGSEDATPAIARSFGAEVKFHPWRDDFSWARNKSISYATGDWVLCIDADEELCGGAEALSALKREISKERDYNAFTLTMEDIVQGQCRSRFATPRIFRRGCVTFQSIVHNRPIIKGGDVARQSKSGAFFRHYGYDLSKEQMERKYRLRMDLLKKRIEVNPDDFDSYYYLAQTYGSFGKIDEAQKAAEIYIKYREKNRRFNVSIYPLLAEIYLIKGKDTALEWVFQEAYDIMPLDVDMAWIRFQWAMKRQDLKDVLNATDLYIKCYKLFETKEAIEQRATKFVFNYSPEKYAAVLSTSCLNLLKLGMDRLNEFGELSTQASEDIGTEALRDALLNIGINWNHDTTQPEEEGDEQWDRQKMH